MEKRNIYTGFWMLLLFSALGAGLQMWLAKNNFMTPDGMELVRDLLKTTHVHALCLAFANILFGLSADVLMKPGKLRTVASWMILVGTVLFPVGLLAEMFGISFATILIILGGYSFLLGLALVLVGRIFVKES